MRKWLLDEIDLSIIQVSDETRSTRGMVNLHYVNSQRQRWNLLNLQRTLIEHQQSDQELNFDTIILGTTKIRRGTRSGWVEALTEKRSANSTKAITAKS